MEKGWSLEKVKWSKLPTKLVKEKAWSHVEFNMVAAKVIPAKPGIYFACAAPMGRRRSEVQSGNDLFGWLYNVIYIGISGNLRQRFQDHCNQPKDEIRMARQCFTNNLEFWFTTKLELDEINPLEKQFQECFGPPACDRIGGGIILAKIGNSTPA